MRIYAALKAAKKRGAKVKILYDGKSQGEQNEEALTGSGLAANVKARTKAGNFAHNKFLLFRNNGKSAQVWTGSTNLSENGLFGHSNNAHIVRDADIAETYFNFWKILQKDQTKKPTSPTRSAPPL